jgi:hypothetical protein
MKTLYLVSFAIASLSAQSFAQNGKLQVTIKDRQDKSLLSGVTIRTIPYLQQGISGEDGTVEISQALAGNYEVVVTHIGYKPDTLQQR